MDGFLLYHTKSVSDCAFASVEQRQSLYGHRFLSCIDYTFHHIAVFSLVLFSHEISQFDQVPVAYSVRVSFFALGKVGTCKTAGPLLEVFWSFA